MSEVDALANDAKTVAERAEGSADQQFGFSMGDARRKGEYGAGAVVDAANKVVRDSRLFSRFAMRLRQGVLT